jgi:hypothetical protein
MFTMKYSVIISEPVRVGANGVHEYLSGDPKATLEAILTGARNAWNSYLNHPKTPFTTTGKPDDRYLEDNRGRQSDEGGFLLLGETITRLMSGVDEVLTTYWWNAPLPDGVEETGEQKSLKRKQAEFMGLAKKIVHLLQMDVDNPRACEVHAQHAERLAQHVLEKLIARQPGRWQDPTPRGAPQKTFRAAAIAYRSMLKKWLDISANVENRLSDLHAASGKRRHVLAAELMRAPLGGYWLRSDLLFSKIEPSVLFREPAPADASPVGE